MNSTFERNITALGDGLGLGALTALAIEDGGLFFIVATAIAAFGVYLKVRDAVRAATEEKAK